MMANTPSLPSTISSPTSGNATPPPLPLLHSWLHRPAPASLRTESERNPPLSSAREPQTTPLRRLHVRQSPKMKRSPSTRRTDGDWPRCLRLRSKENAPS
ncbi:hypothetical protein CIHG_02363 [Coccidioides immitis H538.4]|uniref:Uncharacterized protein n=1 Tax=Coccidioides immitis H538.4 TaxID=396776 RepID=A0A0J8RKU4_COCIT|nr:hypothetical protein CIHG_02363 [Coccidioides immitis H538.4]